METSIERQYPAPMSSPGVWPTLRSPDPARLLEFLVRVLGFVEVARMGADGQIDHAEALWPEGGGVMLGRTRDDVDSVWNLTPGTAGVYVVTADPGAVHDRAVDAGAHILQPLQPTDYGSVECAVVDPDGNRWSFGTYPGASV